MPQLERWDNLPAAVRQQSKADPGFRLEREQFLVEYDEGYTRLKDRMRERLENVHADPYYSGKFERMLLLWCLQKGR